MLTKTNKKIKRPIKGKDYLNLMDKKAVKEFISKLKSVLQKELLKIILFGSKIKGTANKDSDIDILIVLKNKNARNLNQIVNILVDIQLNYDSNISPLIYSEYEFRMNKKMGSYLIKSIEKEGIPL